jgi:hypothetical protein
VVKEASLRLEMRGTVGLMDRAEIIGEGVGTWGGLERVYGVWGIGGLRGRRVVCGVATYSHWLV